MSWASFNLSFYALCIVLLWLAVRGILGGRTIFAFPTLAAMMGLAWVVPQGIELEGRPLNPYASEAFWVYVTACFLCIAIGFRYGKTAERKRLAHSPKEKLPQYDNKRLLIAAAGLTALGFLAQFQMRGIDTSQMRGQWTGVITMWALLDKANGFGLCLAVLVFVRTKWWGALFIAAFAAIPIIQAGVFSVRREALFDLVILTAGAWYLAKRSYPPRGAVIVALILGTVILNSVDELRGRVIGGEENLVEVLASEEIYRKFDYTGLDQGIASEVGLAQFDFWYVNRNLELNFGASYWNKFVHQYFPAFIFGRELKESIKIRNDSMSRGGQEIINSTGSTRTGFSDTYSAFFISGPIVFIFIGIFFGSLFAKSSINSINSQFIYLILLAEGLKAVTHSTGEFFVSLPFSFGLYWAAFGFAELKRGRSKKLAFPAI